MIHWAQAVRHDTYGACDYGPAENKRRYNTTAAPLYDLREFPSNTTRLVVFAGSKDDLSDPKDLAHGLALIPGSIKYTALPTYGHLDFVWGNSTYKDVYPEVLTAIHESYGRPA